MRWESLFADLEGQLAAEDAQTLAEEVSDRSRRELARLRLVDRARAGIGTQVVIGLGAAGTASGRLVRVGPDWCLLAPEVGAEVLVPVAAVAWVRGLPVAATDPETVSVVDERLGLGYILRGVARDRSALTLHLRDSTVLTGTVDGVGADFLDLAEHPPEEARRASAVRAVRAIPFHALARVMTAQRVTP